MNHTVEAQEHFQRAIELAPSNDEAHFFYGRWLLNVGRIADAINQLQTAVNLNPSRLPASDMLASAYVDAGDTEKVRQTATKALSLDPSDTAAKAILAQPASQNSESWIHASLYQYQVGNYKACIADAQQALKLKPDFDLAYVNIGAAYAGLHQWDLAIENERQALRVNPNLNLARNNLDLYIREKAGQGVKSPANPTAEDWLNASLADCRAGQYEKSIQDARSALHLRPDYPEAYNNLAAAYDSMGHWDEAISAAKTALRLKPDFQLAKNNLAWAGIRTPTFAKSND
jgi:tetratricopeptide (TPR) repeat protein